jgi:ribosomal-protein-serine acetyltransferase
MTTIRPYRSDDAPALWAAARESQPEVFRWLDWCRPDYSLADAESWCSSRAALAASGQEYSFVISAPDGEFLGGCGLNQINTVNRFANLGYWVRTSATGRGVATAAVRELARFTFASTNLVRLEILCAVDNVRSQRVAEAAGALCEGVLRSRLLLHGRPVDAVLHSLVRGERGFDPAR